MITNEKYLLYILGVNKGQLDYLLAHIEDYYYSFERVKFNKFTDKPKKNSNGEIATRQINSSRGKLKEVQTRLYDFMSKQVKIPQYIYGGIRGKNNVRNARLHQGNKYIFTADLKSFFPSISHKQVFQMFLREGCTPAIARILTISISTSKKHASLICDYFSVSNKDELIILLYNKKFIHYLYEKAMCIINTR